MTMQIRPTWKRHKISDLIKNRVLEIGDGYRAKNSEMDTTGLPFARAGNVNNGFNFDDADLLCEKSVLKAKEKTSQPDDSVITTKGTFGRVAYVRTTTPKFVYSPQLCYWRVLNPSKLHPRFVFYWLQGNDFLSQAFQVKSSTDMADYASLKDQRSMSISAPEGKSQQKIAAVLSAYDDLIENNKRRIALLEKIAEEVYREWFVRLRFPGHEKVKVVKGVPEGWEHGKASAFFSIVKGKSYAGDEVTENPSHMPFITLKSFNRGGGYREEGLKYYSGRFKEDQIVRQNDIVMAVTDMTQNREVVGRVAKVPDLGDKGAVISLDVIKIVPTKTDSTYLYTYFMFSGFADYIKEFSNGANVLHLKPDLVTQQRITVPPRPLQLKFAEKVKPLYKQTDLLVATNQRLTATRDMLLPRLLSGKLSVEDLEIMGL